MNTQKDKCRKKFFQFGKVLVDNREIIKMEEGYYFAKKKNIGSREVVKVFQFQNFGLVVHRLVDSLAFGVEEFDFLEDQPFLMLRPRAERCTHHYINEGDYILVGIDKIPYWELIKISVVKPQGIMFQRFGYPSLYDGQRIDIYGPKLNVS